MSFPAFFALFEDDELTLSRIRVYMHLQPPLLNHTVPTPIKVETVVQLATKRRRKIGRRQVIEALAWLVRRGYVREHGRASRGVRKLTLEWGVPDPARAQRGTGLSAVPPRRAVSS